jgi:hypothetical protein
VILILNCDINTCVTGYETFCELGYVLCHRMGQRPVIMNRQAAWAVGEEVKLVSARNTTKLKMCLIVFYILLCAT